MVVLLLLMLLATFWRRWAAALQRPRGARGRDRGGIVNVLLPSTATTSVIDAVAAMGLAVPAFAPSSLWIRCC